MVPITHSFSKTYNNGIYNYYGSSFLVTKMNGATVNFMNDNTVIETVTILNATQNITVTPNPSTAFNKVVTTFVNNYTAFYEIEILGAEAE